MPTYGPYGYGSYPYQQNYQGGVQPNFYPGVPQNTPQTQLNQYAFVNGIEGAKAFQVPMNQTMLLMDNDNPLLYLKSSNNMGQSSLRYFKLVEVSEAELRGTAQPQIEFATKEDLQILSNKILEIQKRLDPKENE